MLRLRSRKKARKSTDSIYRADFTRSGEHNTKNQKKTHCKSAATSPSTEINTIGPGLTGDQIEPLSTRDLPQSQRFPSKKLFVEAMEEAHRSLVARGHCMRSARSSLLVCTVALRFRAKTGLFGLNWRVQIPSHTKQKLANMFLWSATQKKHLKIYWKWKWTFDLSTELMGTSMA